MSTIDTKPERHGLKATGPHNKPSTVKDLPNERTKKPLNSQILETTAPGKPTSKEGGAVWAAGQPAKSETAQPNESPVVAQNEDKMRSHVHPKQGPSAARIASASGASQAHPKDGTSAARGEMRTEKEHLFLVFGKYDPSEVSIRDPSLMRYVSLKSKKIPHTYGKNTRHRFQKGDLSIVERLINKLMRSGQGKRKLSGKYIRGRGGCGKKVQAMHIVEDAFGIVEKRTGKNPLQVLVEAIQNAGPREDVTRIQKGGVSYTISVDVAPLKKVDEALKNLSLAAFSGSFNTKTSAAEALAKELIAAGNEENTSFSVKRRDEMERIAKASR